MSEKSSKKNHVVKQVIEKLQPQQQKSLSVQLTRAHMYEEQIK